MADATHGSRDGRLHPRHDRRVGRDGPLKPGAINGGFFPKSGDQPPIPSLVIEVEDIRAHIAKVTAAGGEVIGEPHEIPGVGQFVAFVDTEGNRLSMIQPPTS